jgi:hypothetical protein
MILELLAEVLGVDDVFNFIFLMIVNLNRWWW